VPTGNGDMKPEHFYLLIREVKVKNIKIIIIIQIIYFISPLTGPEGPRGFQEIKVPRFRENGPGWW